MGDLNIASSRAKEHNTTLRDLLEKNAARSVTEFLRRIEAYKRTNIQLGVSEHGGVYFLQLIAGPFTSEEEAFSLFEDLAQHKDEAMKRLASYGQRIQDETDAPDS